MQSGAVPFVTNVCEADYAKTIMRRAPKVAPAAAAAGELTSSRISETENSITLSYEYNCSKFAYH